MFLSFSHTHKTKRHPFAILICISDYYHHIAFFLENFVGIVNDFTKGFKKMLGIFCI